MADQHDHLLFKGNDTFFAYHNDYPEQEDLQMHPFVQVVGLVVFFVYIFLVTFGIPANVYVLWRMYRLAKDDHEKYTNGTGVGLLTMAAADLLSLIFISTHNVLHSIPLDASPAVKSAVCKVITYFSLSFQHYKIITVHEYLSCFKIFSF